MWHLLGYFYRLNIVTIITMVHLHACFFLCCFSEYLVEYRAKEFVILFTYASHCCSRESLHFGNSHANFFRAGTAPASRRGFMAVRCLQNLSRPGFFIIQPGQLHCHSPELLAWATIGAKVAPNTRLIASRLYQNIGAKY